MVAVGLWVDSIGGPIRWAATGSLVVAQPLRVRFMEPRDRWTATTFATGSPDHR